MRLLETAPLALSSSQEHHASSWDDTPATDPVRKAVPRPLFQRQYTWGTKNHAQLWTDILDQYERLDNHQSNGSQGHYMGSLVRSPISGPFAQHVASALVVDGQQRLTTMGPAGRSWSRTIWRRREPTEGNGTTVRATPTQV
jgi:Protein of unknown function DUF262